MKKVALTGTILFSILLSGVSKHTRADEPSRDQVRGQMQEQMRSLKTG